METDEDMTRDKYEPYQEADTTELEASVEDLPPSSKLVYKTLEYGGPQTQKELRENSRLSQRTIRNALSKLEEQDAIVEDVYLRDARQSLYKLNIDED